MAPVPKTLRTSWLWRSAHARADGGWVDITASIGQEFKMLWGKSADLFKVGLDLLCQGASYLRPGSFQCMEWHLKFVYK